MEKNMETPIVYRGYIDYIGVIIGVTMKTPQTGFRRDYYRV